MAITNLFIEPERVLACLCLMNAPWGLFEQKGIERNNRFVYANVMLGSSSMGATDRRKIPKDSRYIINLIYKQTDALSR